jgi:Tfp pilus assembly PilM family ATPase
VRKKDIITALEITDRYLKIAQSAWIKNKREIVALEAKALSGGIDDKAIAGEISGLFKAKFIKKDQRIILCLPRYLVTTRYLKVPSRNPVEIEQIIGLQAPKYLPYPSEELISGYYLIGQDSEGYSQIFLVIVHRDVINRHLKIIKDSGLLVTMVLVSSYGLYNWYLSSHANLEMSGPLVVVNIDYTYQDLEVISKGKLIFSRSFSVEAKPQDPTQINIWQDKIIEEINRSLVAYQKDNIDKNPAKIVITGSSKNITGLEKKISGALSLPVEIASSLEKVSLKDKSRWENTNFSFTSLIGMALGSPLESLDLLPKETREKKIILVQKKEWLKALILFIGLLLTILLWITKNLYDKTNYLKRIEADLNKIAPEAKSLEVIKNQLEIIREQFNVPASSIDVLAEFYRLTPREITFNSLAFDEKNQLVVKGQAQDLSDVFKFVTTLEKSEYFQGVSVKSATKRKTQLIEVADFEIVCPLSKRK